MMSTVLESFVDESGRYQFNVRRPPAKTAPELYDESTIGIDNDLKAFDARYREFYGMHSLSEWPGWWEGGAE